jgi:hypothetical protein
VLRFGDGGVVGEDDSAEGRVDVAGVWEAAAAVAEPEDVPARNVAVGRVSGLGRGFGLRLVGGALGPGTRQLCLIGVEPAFCLLERSLSFVT